MPGPLSYIGGKNRLARQIIALLPDHLTYVEPFSGGAQVFFRKDPSRIEVLNDLDQEVVNFFRVCQQHYDELLRYLKYLLVSRSWYAVLSKSTPETLTDIQRAARFFYIQKNSFAGLVRSPHYKATVVGRPNYNPARIPMSIEAAHRRLQNVQLECLPYQKILEKYDRPTTLFFIDPPYWNRYLYRFNLSENDFQELAKRLEGLRGKFVLTLNDVPEVRALFAKFIITEVQISYSAQRKAGRRYAELIIRNFK